MISFTRVLTVVMFGVICFVLIVPLALQRHNMLIALGISGAFVVYAIANVVLWQRMKPRA